MNAAYPTSQCDTQSKARGYLGAGHVSNLEKPAEFNTIVRDFCLPLSTI